MKKIIILAAALLLSACEQPETSQASTAPGDDPAPVVPAVPVDSSALLGTWFNVSGDPTVTQSGVQVCQPVAPECSGVSVVPYVMEFQSATRAGWFLSMETISISVNQITFQSTGLVVSVELTDATHATVDFGQGCKRQYELQ